MRPDENTSKPGGRSGSWVGELNSSTIRRRNERSERSAVHGYWQSRAGQHRLRLDGF